MLPAIRRQLKAAFRGLDPEARDEAVQEGIRPLSVARQIALVGRVQRDDLTVDALEQIVRAESAKADNQHPRPAAHACRRFKTPHAVVNRC